MILLRASLACALGALTFACGMPGATIPAATAPVGEGRPSRPVQMPEGDATDSELRAVPPGPLPVKARAIPMPTEARLSNGVRVVLLERHDFPSVSTTFVLDGGAAVAPPGIAAAYADAMFGSSSEYKGGEAWEYLRFVGASMRAAATPDAVVLQTTALTPLIVSALSRSAPMFTSPLLETEDVESAWTRVLAARSAAAESPAELADEELRAAVFRGHGYAVPPSGRGTRADSPRDARAAAREIGAFRDRWLSAEHVSIACVGDFKRDVILRALERALGKLPRRGGGEAPDARLAAIPKPAPQVLLVDRPGAVQSNVAVGWAGPRATDDDAVAFEVLSAAMGGQLSARLNLTVRKELGASYGVQMSSEALRAGGMVSIRTAVETGQTAGAVAAVLRELARVRTEPLSDAELVAAKLRSYLDVEQGTTAGLSRMLAEAIARGLPPAHVSEHNARVDALTARDVRAAADRRLAPEAAVVVIVGDAAKIESGVRSLGLGDVVVRR